MTCSGHECGCLSMCVCVLHLGQRREGQAPEGKALIQAFIISTQVCDCACAPNFI